MNYSEQGAFRIAQEYASQNSGPPEPESSDKRNWLPVIGFFALSVVVIILYVKIREIDRALKSEKNRPA
jgi:hypothetical protein